MSLKAQLKEQWGCNLFWSVVMKKASDQMKTLCNAKKELGDSVGIKPQTVYCKMGNQEALEDPRAVEGEKEIEHKEDKEERQLSK